MIIHNIRMDTQNDRSVRRAEETAEDDDLSSVPPEEQITKLRTLIRQCRDERWDAVSKKEEYKRRVVLITGKLIKLKEDVDKYKYSLSRLRKLTQQLNGLYQTEFTQFKRSMVKSVQHTIQTERAAFVCTDACKKLSTSLVEKEKQHKALVLEYDKAKHAEQSRSTEIERVREDMKTRDKENARIQAQMRAKENEHQMEVKRLEGDVHLRTVDIGRLKIELEDMKQQIHQSNQKQKELQHTLQSSTQQQKDLSQKLQATEHQQEELKKKLQSAAQHQSELQLKLQASTKMTAAGSPEVHQLKTKLREMEKSAQNERLKYQHELSEAAKQREQLKTQVSSTISEERRKLEEEMEYMKQQYKLKVNQRARKQILEVETEKNKLLEQQQKMEAAFKLSENKLLAQTRTAQNKLKDKIDSLQRRLADAESSKAEREQSLQSDITYLKEQLQSDGRGVAANTMNLQRDEIERLREERKALREKIQELERVIKREVMERQELKEALKQANSTIDKLRQPKPKSMMMDDEINAMRVSQPNSESLAVKRTIAKTLQPKKSHATDLNELRQSYKQPHTVKSLDHLNKYLQNATQDTPMAPSGGQQSNEAPITDRDEKSNQTTNRKSEPVKEQKPIQIPDADSESNMAVTEQKTDSFPPVDPTDSTRQHPTFPKPTLSKEVYKNSDRGMNKDLGLSGSVESLDGMTYRSSKNTYQGLPSQRSRPGLPHDYAGNSQMYRGNSQTPRGNPQTSQRNPHVSEPNELQGDAPIPRSNPHTYQGNLPTHRNPKTSRGINETSLAHPQHVNTGTSKRFNPAGLSRQAYQNATGNSVSSEDRQAIEQVRALAMATSYSNKMAINNRLNNHTRRPMEMYGDFRR